MPDPIRLVVLKALCATLETITPTNGYDHDLTNRVFRGRGLFSDREEVPLISILEKPLPEEPFGGGIDSTEQVVKFELLIQGFVEDERDNPTDPAHLLMADVKKRLAEEKKKLSGPRGFAGDSIFDLGNVVTGLTIGQGTVRPPDEISTSAYFWMEISVEFAERLNIA